MRTITRELKIYRFDELSETAKENAITTFGSDCWDSSEMLDRM